VTNWRPSIAALAARPALRRAASCGPAHEQYVPAFHPDLQKCSCRPIAGVDGVPGAEGGSKARSGTGATRREASMARTNPLTRPSTWQQSSMGGLSLMNFQFCQQDAASRMPELIQIVHQRR
jgi:hypothetical protein